MTATNCVTNGSDSNTRCYSTYPFIWMDSKTQKIFSAGFHSWQWQHIPVIKYSKLNKVHSVLQGSGVQGPTDHSAVSVKAIIVIGKSNNVKSYIWKLHMYHLCHKLEIFQEIFHGLCYIYVYMLFRNNYMFLLFYQNVTRRQRNVQYVIPHIYLCLSNSLLDLLWTNCCKIEIQIDFFSFFGIWLE